MADAENLFARPSIVHVYMLIVASGQQYILGDGAGGASPDVIRMLAEKCDFLLAGYVPDFRGLVVGKRDDVMIVGGEKRSMHGSFVAGEKSKETLRIDVEQPDDRFFSAGAK